MSGDGKNNTEKNSGGSETLLTDSQKRSLTSSLFVFEQALRKAFKLLSEDDEIGILYSKKSHLSSEKRQFVKAIISQTLMDLADFAMKMGLGSMELSVEGTIMADMSVGWESIEECRSKRLQGYGKLNPRAIQLIDPVIDHLAQTAIDLSSLVTNNSQDDNSEEIQK